MTRMLKLCLMISCVVTLFCPRAGAQTINAASCSQSDVQTALNSVAADGTTVVIPAGTCTWSTSVNYNQVFSTTIQGESTVTGSCSPSSTSCVANDNTIIVDNLNHNGSDPGTFDITTASGKSFRLTGLTFNWGSSTSTYHGTVQIQGQSQAVRVDHNHFNRISVTDMTIGGWTYGVVDHNFFDVPTSGGWNGVKVNEVGWNNETAGNGDNSWADTTTFGSNRFLFVENNYFNNPANISTAPANDCDHGGRYVWRYNVMSGVELQTHPTGPGGDRGRGCRAHEVYNNLVVGGSGRFNFMFLSSGTELMWGNTANNSGNAVYQEFVTIHSMRKDNSTYTQSPTPNGWGYCGTSFTGTGSNWDENISALTGYRCMDQPGQGVGDLLVNGFPNVTNSATGCSSSSPCAWPREALEPVYEWMDTWTSTGGGSFYLNDDPTVLIPNSDYYLCTTPGTGSCNGFTGASGVGSGLLSARPSTCLPLVAYWATDTQTLYQCATPNTWTTYYTPYTYPHPLDTAGSGDPPAAPSNLKATIN
jgi:hypothetical protein